MKKSKTFSKRIESIDFNIKKIVQNSQINKQNTAAFNRI